MHIMGIFKFTLIVSALTLLVPDVSAYYRGGYGGYYNGFNVLGNGSPSFGGGYRQLGHNGIAYEAASGLSGIGHGGHTLSGLNTNLNNINRGIEDGADVVQCFIEFCIGKGVPRKRRHEWAWQSDATAPNGKRTGVQ
ncbi:uncharacterized protein LOC115446269 [Manduca sexta]|uniref:uncharacterized protein LOC115446269 n=1 Tax=Manduca sexta TaxID=7130 RepID=UPI00188EE7DA|nr:uncharacterized protein LOC115446269 [Manduca sexta]